MLDNDDESIMTYYPGRYGPFRGPKARFLLAGSGEPPYIGRGILVIASEESSTMASEEQKMIPFCSAVKRSRPQEDTGELRRKINKHWEKHWAEKKDYCEIMKRLKDLSVEALGSWANEDHVLDEQEFRNYYRNKEDNYEFARKQRKDNEISPLYFEAREIIEKYGGVWPYNRDGPFTEYPPKDSATRQVWDAEWGYMGEIEREAESPLPSPVRSLRAPVSGGVKIPNYLCYLI